jgi:hypothetical protein
LDSALGPLVVVTPNDGKPVRDVGARVNVDWVPGAVRTLSSKS